MKIINFSCEEKLGKLLSKECAQTIRPSFFTSSAEEKPLVYKHPDCKPPRYKVGEKIRLYWQQRSKYKWFCSNCGIGLECSEAGIINSHCEGKPAFHKVLGIGEITEVFKIGIQRLDNGMSRGYSVGMVDGIYGIVLDRQLSNLEETGLNKSVHIFVNQLYRLDGFSSAEQMFKWFNKRYDLNQPKQFYCYRWRWL